MKRIQTIIIDLTSAISRYGAANRNPIPNVYTKELEDWISEYSKELPPPEQYIIPVSVYVRKRAKVILKKKTVKYIEK